MFPEHTAFLPGNFVDFVYYFSLLFLKRFFVCVAHIRNVINASCRLRGSVQTAPSSNLTAEIFERYAPSCSLRFQYMFSYHQSVGSPWETDLIQAYVRR